MAQVPAARQVLDILRFLADQAGPVPAAALARELGLPRSTTYHLLGELTATGFVVHLPDERRYGLGVSAYELGSGFTRQAPLQRLARRPLSELTDRTGHTSHLAVLHGRDVVYVIEERARGRAPLVTDVGVRLPAPLTASGRAMLAVLPPAAVRALFPTADGFVLRNERGPDSPAALRRLLAETRRRGHALEEGEVTAGFASVGTPVLDHSGHPIAAVALTFPEHEVPDEDGRRSLAAQVARTAGTISRLIGG
ncbi:transcriptional regulator, IclR family [Geodermatophilus saharensis]|uniref:Transcriptional regulator, IclR family n=1 Tax=Geodermatophilus saharensis TaxID=1137994 RepID=A0A239D456_9ACTN|nr:IclR family transcriptional regulator [Geodermatophilus saharensis]SNS26818.1 transcriptional regulator, IclR family [Geodermatophilus saharensis]